MTQHYADLSQGTYVSAQEYDLLVLKLAKKIKDDGFKPDYIIQIERGGFAPLRRLLDAFEGVPYDTFRVEHYQERGKTLEKPRILQELRHPQYVKGRSILVVDDCTDTGKTAQFVEKYLTDLGASEVRIGVLFHKPHSAYKPSWYVGETESWIYFFYDTIDTGRQLRRTGMARSQVLEQFRKIKVPEEEIKLIAYFIP